MGLQDKPLIKCCILFETVFGMSNLSSYNHCGIWKCFLLSCLFSEIDRRQSSFLTLHKTVVFRGRKTLVLRLTPWSYLLNLPLPFSIDILPFIYTALLLPLLYQSNLPLSTWLTAFLSIPFFGKILRDFDIRVDNFYLALERDRATDVNDWLKAVSLVHARRW